MNPSDSLPLDRRLQEFVHYAELKHLAYTLVALQQERRFYSLAVLSLFPGEGKTLFCAALAMAYAELCRTKVLIVDTSTFQNKNSISLKDCFNGTTPLVEIKSFDELKKNAGKPISPPAGPGNAESGPVLHAEVVMSRSMPAPVKIDNDFSLIKRAAEESASQYGLVLFDTAALRTKNRNNIDPMLVARLSAASVLVASRTLLDSPDVGASLAMVRDPSLHLLGIVSNEGVRR